jgi:hypothetical protein
VEFVMVSHVDDDHIKGILDLTKDQRAQPDVKLKVASLWHNSFDDLLKTKPDELTAGFGAASLGGGVGGSEAGFDAGSVLASVGRSALDGDVELEGEGEFQAAEVLASIPQGRLLRDDAERLKWKPNHKFKGKLILASEQSEPVQLDGGLKLTVIGPMLPELLALQDAHDKWLREQKDKKKKSAESALAAYLDESVANLSSIVVLAELDGKSMLLTGDARGDKILEGMELIGLVEKGGTLDVDILKIPHHGSAYNADLDLFQRINARHYVFSGDGEHGNPERETFEMLLKARGDEANYEIHLTYPVEELDQGREQDWNKERNKHLARKKKNPKAKVREEWSGKEHSLAALFQDNPEFGAKVRIVDAENPHLIALLDPVKL